MKSYEQMEHIRPSYSVSVTQTQSNTILFSLYIFLLLSVCLLSLLNTYQPIVPGPKQPSQTQTKNPTGLGKNGREKQEKKGKQKFQTTLFLDNVN